MITPSSKTLTEASWDMVNQSSSSNLQPASNHIEDFPAGTSSIRPSVNLGEAIYYHDMGLMEKLTCKITAWLRKQVD